MYYYTDITDVSVVHVCTKNKKKYRRHCLLSQGCPKQKSYTMPKKWIEMDQNDAYTNFGGLTCVEDIMMYQKIFYITVQTLIFFIFNPNASFISVNNPIHSFSYESKRGSVSLFQHGTGMIHI